MAATTEIERMVARLVGDSSSYTAMLRQAQRDAAATADQVERAGGRIQNMGQTLQGFAATAASTLAALGTFGRLRQAFALFAGQEEAETKLTAAIDASGNAVLETMDRYQEFASVLQGVTTTGRQTTFTLLAQAEQLGLTGAAAEQAVRQYVGAQAAGIPVNIRMIAALQQGHTEILTRYIPALRGIKDPAQRAAIAQDFLNRAFKVAEAEAGTVAGQLKILQNLWMDFEKSLGVVIAEAIKPTVKWLQSLVEWLDSLSIEAKQNIVIVLAVATAILGLVPAIRIVSALYGAALFNPFVLGLVAATIAAVAFAHEVGGWRNALNIAYGWLLRVADGVRVAVDWLLRFLDENQKLVLGVGIAAAALAALYVVVRVGAVTFALLQAVFLALRLNQALSIAGWLAWQAIMLSAALTTTVFNVTMALLTSYLGIGLVLALAWSAAVLVAKVATWLWNVALTAMNILLAGATILAAVVAVIALAAAFALVYASVYAVVSTASSVLDLLLGLPTAYGPLSYIGGLFGQWFDILKDIYGVMTIDLDLATKLFYAGVALAVNQIRDLWPPLWDFIGKGFVALTDFVKLYLYLEFSRVILQIGKLMNETIEEASGGHIKASDEFKARIEKTLKDIDDVEKIALGQAGDRLRQAADDFKVVEGGATAEARIRVEMLQREAKDKIKAGRKQDEPEAYDFGQAIGDQISKGLKDSKFDSTLRFSAEAMTRLATYGASLAHAPAGAMSPIGAGAGRGGDQVAANDVIPNLLRNIRDELRAQEPFEFRNADLANA